MVYHVLQELVEQCQKMLHFFNQYIKPNPGLTDIYDFSLAGLIYLTYDGGHSNA